jgi:hypothetical protein
VAQALLAHAVVHFAPAAPPRMPGGSDIGRVIRTLTRHAGAGASFGWSTGAAPFRRREGQLILSHGRGNAPLVRPWRWEQPQTGVIHWTGKGDEAIAPRGEPLGDRVAGIDLGEVHPAVVCAGEHVLIANGGSCRVNGAVRTGSKGGCSGCSLASAAASPVKAATLASASAPDPGDGAQACQQAGHHTASGRRAHTGDWRCA